MERDLYRHFSLIISRSCRSKPFVAVSGTLAVEFLVVANVSSSHEQEIFPAFSLDQNSIEFEIQKDRNYYIVLRQTFFASKRKLIDCHGYETYTAEEKSTRILQKGMHQEIQHVRKNKEILQSLWSPM